MAATYECPYCSGEKLAEQDEYHFLSRDSRGNEVAVYVFYCRRCKETFHCYGGMLEHV
jgi:uncharacterized protein YbaR (Trm112 family)